MWCRIHVFHRPTGQVLDAEFKTINGHDAPTIIRTKKARMKSAEDVCG
jgi:hypothetical protein